MSAKSTTVRDGKINWEDIQLVQKLIERCLELYMTQQEIVKALSLQANIEPGLTNLVWEKLQEQNPDFFRAYGTRLRVKEQIREFNGLVSKCCSLPPAAYTRTIVIQPPIFCLKVLVCNLGWQVSQLNQLTSKQPEGT